MSTVSVETSKAIVLQYLGNPEHMAKEIARRFQGWKNSRRPWERAKKELREFVFATDTTQTSNSSLPWKNKTTLPKLCQVRDNLHANYMAALFPKDQWFTWEGHNNESVSKDKADIIKAYMTNKTRISQFKNVVSQLVYDWIDFGNCFADVEYVREVVTLPSGEELQGYVGPRLIRVSPLDIVFDITAKSFESSPKITRSICSIGDIAKSVHINPEAEHFKKILDDMHGVRGAFSQLGAEKGGTFAPQDRGVTDGFIVDGFGSAQEYFESGMVEILEFEGDIYDPFKGELLVNHIVTVLDRTHVVRSEPINNWLGRSTKQHVGWRLRPDNIMAMGPLDNLVGMQYRIDHLENLKADIFDVIAGPLLKVRGEVDDFDYKPHEKIYLGDDGDVTMLVPDTTVLNADTQIAILEQKMEEFAGAPKQAMGFRTPGEKTKYEVQSLDNAGGRIFQNKITYFEEQFLEPCLNNMFEAARRNIDGEDVVSILDDDFGVTEFLSINEEDLKASGKLRPVGARHFAAKAEVVQNMTSFANSAIGQDPDVKVHISGLETAKLLSANLDVDGFSLVSPYIRISEQAESARLMQTAQQQIQEEAAVPDEEDF